MRQLLMSIFGWILTASNNILPLNRRPVVHAQQHREIRTAENIEPRGDVVVQDRPGFAIRPWPVR